MIRMEVGFHGSHIVVPTNRPYIGSTSWFVRSIDASSRKADVMQGKSCHANGNRRHEVAVRLYVYPVVCQGLSTLIDPELFNKALLLGDKAATIRDCQVILVL